MLNITSIYRMKNYKSGLLLLASWMLSACASFSSGPHPGKLERVGVLLVQNCQNSNSDCDEFSLLEPDMHARRVTLSGNIDASLTGKLIAVLGKEELPKRSGMESIIVEQTKAITSFDYQPFIRQAVSDYVQENYFCSSLWDQNYIWRLDNRQPILIASLSNSFEPDLGTIRLEYDGLKRDLLAAERTPGDTNPCQLK
jgi:hypothetical protein